MEHPFFCSSMFLYNSYIIPISIYGSMPINYHIPGGMNIHLPSGKLTLLLNMASYSELSHEKWWFSIVMLVYQRVRTILVFTRVSNKLDRQSFPSWLQGKSTPEIWIQTSRWTRFHMSWSKKAKVGTHKWCKSQSLTYTMFIYVVSVLVQIKLHIPNVVNHNVTFSTFDGHVSQRMSFHISDIINCLIVNHQYYMNFQWPA